MAQNVTDTCTATALYVSDAVYGRFGIIFAWLSDPPDMLDTMKIWAERGEYYTFDDNVCHQRGKCWAYKQVSCKFCSPFSFFRILQQMVLAKVSKMGCAYTYCSAVARTNYTDVNFLTCYYSSKYSNDRPYTKGDSATKCPTDFPFTDGALCSRTPPSPAVWPSYQVLTTVVFSLFISFLT